MLTNDTVSDGSPADPSVLCAVVLNARSGSNRPLHKRLAVTTEQMKTVPCLHNQFLLFVGCNNYNIINCTQNAIYRIVNLSKKNTESRYTGDILEMYASRIYPVGPHPSIPPVPRSIGTIIGT
jgi:hypothetical protein